MRYVIIPLMVLFAPFCWPNEALNRNGCPGKYGAKLVSLQGKVFFDADGSGQWQPARLNDLLCEGSRVKVQPYSRASLVLSNGIILRLDQGTVLSLNGIAPQQPTALDLIKGFIHFISRTPRQLKISSPIANAGPEGTEFAMQVEENKASLWVYEGQVRFFNREGEIKLAPGQAAETVTGQAPKAQITVKPEDAVRWALYYPAILPYPQPSAIIDGTTRSAIDRYRHGSVDDALMQLDAVPPEKQSTYFFKVRAAVRLTAGRVILAREDIRQLLADNPKDAEALALEAIIALTQNRKDEALTLANQAIASDSNSATAYSALSYAEQGRFDLDKALAAADQATKLAPHDAMVWARKAELEFSKGLTKDSEQAAKRALELDPTLERTQTVTGFSYLMRMEADTARESFEQAVKFDSTSPLARLGLGLAKIRGGDLEEGRRDLEIAAILDPENSLVRSYLGKAYYEERRSSLAEEQFKLAKERDPKDPTPYFYDAINKQTTNRPVEALHDMQKAIELNDNLGVYRSKLSLDRDLAARSAAQGRIYNELGFQQRGLWEGWKSINTDPANYSGHRLLADNYAALPRHELARVSELLQSQLLQPINITPIQPNLAENNLFILNGFGPSDLSFNEFNPLFEYNRLALQASGLVGSYNTWSDNTTLSGLYDNVSFSLGQFHYESDGFRENNFLEKDLYNAFIQAQVTENFNLQAEYRHEERSNGDLSNNFFRDLQTFAKNSSYNISLDSYRLGGNYRASLNSSIIGSLIFQDVNTQTNNDNRIDKTLTYRNGFISEVQFLYDNNFFNSIAGFGHINQVSHRMESSNPIPTDTSPTKTNIYNYSKFDYKGLRTTLGISADFFHREEKDLDINRINPKFGIEWSPSNTTTIRAAVFRTMSMAQVASQTIEPTQIAGFNQFFDDFANGTLSWRYGAGVDHRFSRNLSSGFEYSERKLDFPGNAQSIERSEQNGRVYFYYTPIDQLSMSSEYFYERIDQSDRILSDTTGQYLWETTHRFPLTLGWFHPTGLSLKIRNSLVFQSGLFSTCTASSICGSNPPTIPGNSTFDVVDLYLSYRLPKRFGIVGFGVNNLFDDRFNYQNANVNSFINPTDNILSPDRFIYSRFTLAF